MDSQSFETMQLVLDRQDYQKRARLIATVALVVASFAVVVAGIVFGPPGSAWACLGGLVGGAAASVVISWRRLRHRQIVTISLAAEPAPEMPPAAESRPALVPGADIPTAELLERIADGRDYYIEGASEHARETLIGEVGAFRAAARIARGDRSTVWCWMPTHMLTDDMERTPDEGA